MSKYFTQIEVCSPPSVAR